MFAILRGWAYPGSIQAQRADDCSPSVSPFEIQPAILRHLDSIGPSRYLWLMSTAKTAGTDWTDGEIDLIVADYFDMLKLEISGVPYVKARA